MSMAQVYAVAAVCGTLMGGETRPEGTSSTRKELRASTTASSGYKAATSRWKTVVIR